MFQISKRSLSYFNYVFNNIQEDIIFKTQSEFIKDQCKSKVNLGIGVYADRKGILPPPTSRYLPLSGDNTFLEISLRFLFGFDNIKNMFKFQTCGGTGALSLAHQIISSKNIHDLTYGFHIPTWGNHFQIFKGDHIYLKNNQLESSQPYDALVIQTSCHNPTGNDYTDIEKNNILNYVEKNNIVLIMDTAYFGLSGNINEERQFLQSALVRDIDLFIPLSYSKIADVYGHRTGVLFFRPKSTIKFKDNVTTNTIIANVEQMIRTNISNVPRYGSDYIMNTYFSDDNKQNNFINKINNMAERINTFRSQLDSDLNINGIVNNIKDGHGMFSLLPLTQKEIKSLQENFHIYLLPNGRINICGLTDNNYDYIINAIIKTKNI